MLGPVQKPTQSWWLQNLENDDLPSPSTAPLPSSADIVVVGAGMTGCATAYWLKRLFGRECLVLDARGCAGGATGRNGGHLWGNPADAFQNETAAEMLAFIEREGVACDLTVDGAVALERGSPEADVRYFDGTDDPEAKDDDEEWGEVAEWDQATCAARLQTGSFSSAAHYSGAAQFYPARVCAALLRHSGAPLHVARVESLTTIADADTAHANTSGADADARPRVVVSTDVGAVRARHVVVATNAWCAELLPELAPHSYPCRNQVIMTRPLPATSAWGVGAFSVDSDVGARELYAIRRPDGRLCLGGVRALEEDAAVGNADDASLSDVVGGYLRTFLATHFPALGGVEVEAEWTGVLGFTRDGKPFVGPLPGRPGVLVAACFCGHGMPQCFGVGKAVARMIEGGEHAEAVHPFIRDEASPARVLGK